DATPGGYPDSVQISFNGIKTIDRVVVYTLQDNYNAPVEPSDTLTFTAYGVRDFYVEGLAGSSWIALGAAVSGNNLVKRTVSFPATSVSAIRVTITNALASYSRLTEIEAWGTSGASAPVSTVTTLSGAPNPGTVGASITLSASVSGNNASGSVTFTENGAPIGCASATLAAGTPSSASCSISTLAAGTHNIVANYSGDAANLASASAPLAQVINAAQPNGINVALAANGGVASASSSYGSGFLASALNNNERAGAGWG